MVTTASRPGRVGIVGAGPAGMAAALSLGQVGHTVEVLERYPAAEPRGNIMNLWPPPVEALDLPGPESDGTPVAQVTLDRYAAHVCDALATGPPAVLVGHSMGGVVVTQAAARCPRQIARLVYVAAFIPGDGQSLLDLTQLPEGAGDQVQANLVVEGDPNPQSSREA